MIVRLFYLERKQNDAISVKYSCGFECLQSETCSNSVTSCGTRCEPHANYMLAEALTSRDQQAKVFCDVIRLPS
jgi:hypothetical protein